MFLFNLNKIQKEEFGLISITSLQIDFLRVIEFCIYIMKKHLKQYISLSI